MIEYYTTGQERYEWIWATHTPLTASGPDDGLYFFRWYYPNGVQRSDHSGDVLLFWTDTGERIQNADTALGKIVKRKAANGWAQLQMRILQAIASYREFYESKHR